MTTASAVSLYLRAFGGGMRQRDRRTLEEAAATLLRQEEEIELLKWRAPPPAVCPGLHVVLAPSVTRALTGAAAARDVEPGVLIARILGILARDRLFDPILDDAPAARARARRSARARSAA